MSERPKALDLFCGAGGAAMGLHRAGFDVTGCDNRKQPRYPFRFVQGDALAPPFRLSDFDLVWASPPCQAYSSLRRLRKQRDPHPKLIEPVRAMLVASGARYVIENVAGAPLKSPLRLCGCRFGLAVKRRRLFECSFFVMAEPCSCSRYSGVAVYGKRPGDRLPDGVQRARDLAHGREAMGIDWMDWRELTQAIPPAYSEHIGNFAMAAA